MNGFIAFLEKQRDDRLMTNEAFADWLKIGKSTLYRYLEGHLPNRDTVDKIAFRTGFDADELWRLAKSEDRFEEDSENDAAAASLLKIIKALPKKQREFAVRMIMELSGENWDN